MDTSNIGTVQWASQNPFGHVSLLASDSTPRRLSTWEEPRVPKRPQDEKRYAIDEKGRMMSALEFLSETRRGPRDRTGKDAGEE